MSSQIELAQEARQLLVNSGQFKSVLLEGSLNGGNIDEYSDIDILIENESIPPNENIDRAIKVLSNRYPIWFIDWAKSLLPEKYLVSVFLKNQSIFWYMDISCLSSGAHPLVDRNSIPQDRVHHFFKLWISNSKQQIRGRHERNQIDLLYRKLFSDSEQNAVIKFEKVLTWLSESSNDKPLLDACTRIVERMKLEENG